MDSVGQELEFQLIWIGKDHAGKFVLLEAHHCRSAACALSLMCNNLLSSPFDWNPTHAIVYEFLFLLIFPLFNAN